MADFETTGDENGVRVWLWGTVPIDRAEPRNVIYDYDIESFIEWAETHPGVVYFHNLRYDGTYILAYLLTHNYKHYAGDGVLIAGEFSSVISDSNKF